MTAYDIAIKLAISGVPEVAGGFNKVAAAGSAANAGLANVASASKQSAGALTGATQSAGALSSGLQQVATSSSGLNTLSSNSTAAASAMETATQRADEFHASAQNFDKMKGYGAGMMAAGAGVLYLASTWQQATRDGYGLSQRLEDLMDKQGRVDEMGDVEKTVKMVAEKGHFDAENPVREAAIHLASFSMKTDAIETMLPLAARQARTMTRGGHAMDVNSVADMLGKGYNDTSLSVLKRSGITVDDSEQSKIDKIKKEQGVDAAREAWVGIVAKAIDQNTVSLEKSLTVGEQKANDAARAKDNLNAELGKGVEEASAVFNETMAGVYNGLLELDKAHPGLLKFVGVGAAVAGVVTVLGGGLLMLVGTLGGAYMNVAALAAMRLAASATETAAVGTVAAAQGVHAGVSTADAAATGTDAAAVGVHTAAVEANAVATMGAGAMIWAAFGPVILGMGMFVVALGALAWAASKYLPEFNHAIDSVKDDRTDDETAQDSDNAQKIRAKVDDSEHLSSKDKLTIYNQASKKLLDLGDEDGAREMQDKINALKATAGGRKARDEMNHGDKAVSSDAERILKEINSTEAHTDKLRADNLPKNDKDGADGSAARSGAETTLDGKPLPTDAAASDAESATGLGAESAAARDAATASAGVEPNSGEPNGNDRANARLGGIAASTYRTKARVSDHTGRRIRIEFDPVDIDDVPVNRQATDYQRTRPA